LEKGSAATISSVSGALRKTRKKERKKERKKGRNELFLTGSRLGINQGRIFVHRDLAVRKQKIILIIKMIFRSWSEYEVT